MRITIYLVIILLLFLLKNSMSQDTLSQSNKKNYVTIECGLFNTVQYDEFINYKNYSCTDFLPIRFSFWHHGNKTLQTINFYYIKTTIESKFSKDYIEKDFADYEGGELAYRCYYNVFRTKRFLLSGGTGILATGSMRNYSISRRIPSIPSLNNIDRFTSSDITATSLLLGILTEYSWKKSFILFELCMPIYNYFQRPSLANSLLLSSHPQEYNTEWNSASLWGYVGYDCKCSMYLHVFRNFFIANSYNVNYFFIKSKFQMKSLKTTATLGLAYNF